MEASSPNLRDDRDRVHASLLVLYELLRISISVEDSDSTTASYSTNSSSDKVLKKQQVLKKMFS